MIARLVTIALAWLLVGFDVAPDGFPDRLPPGLEEPGAYLLQDGARALTPEEAAARFEHLPFPVGERLAYRVRYAGIPVGLAELEIPRLVERGGRVYVHMVATGRTNDAFSALYRIDDRSEAWVDLETRRVTRTRTLLRHGRKQTREEVRFDWATHFVDVRRAKVHRDRLREVAFDFGPHVYDVFDAFYAMRTLPLRIGLEEELPVYASRKVHGFRIRVAGETELSLRDAGSVPVFDLRPLDSLDGEVVDAGRGRVLVSRSPDHVPLRVEGWFRASRSIRIPGVRIELVEHVPGTGWPPFEPAVWRTPPRAAESVEGRPRWDPPPEVQAAREEHGTAAFERKRSLGAHLESARRSEDHAGAGR